MAEKDLYGVLELQPGVAGADVKSAYRKLAKMWHPDKNPLDTEVRSKPKKMAENCDGKSLLWFYSRNGDFRKEVLGIWITLQSVAENGHDHMPLCFQ